MKDNLELSEITADIVASYVGNNTVSMDALPGVIQTVYAALKGVMDGVQPAPEPVALVPAVPIKKSITPDFLISLEDGRKYKSLKRHLRTKYDMSPDEYRAKWGLPRDYPMVAPSYAASRSALAKEMGFGSKGRQSKPLAKAGQPRAAKAATR